MHMYSIVYVVAQGLGKKSWGLEQLLMSDNAHIFWRQSHFFLHFSVIYEYWILYFQEDTGIKENIFL